MRILKKLWYGEYPLGVAFWGFYLFGMLATMLITGTFFHFGSKYGVGRFVFLISLFAFYIYGVIVSVGVWISARRNLADPVQTNRILGLLARAIVFINAARVVWALSNGGALILMDEITGPG